MTPNPLSPLQELEALGYEPRIIDNHVAVINGDGAEVLTLPLSVLDSANSDHGRNFPPESPERVAQWATVLPSDILGRD
jgi:hypothetical protein